MKRPHPHRSKTNFLDLPNDVLAEILTKAASNSPEDYARARESCKSLRDVSNSCLVLSQVNLDNINPVPRTIRDKIFLRKCAEQAEYCYGIIVIHFGDSSKSNGLKMLQSLRLEKKPNPSNIIWADRLRATELLSQTWGVIPPELLEFPSDCKTCEQMSQNQVSRRSTPSNPDPRRWCSEAHMRVLHPEIWQYHILVPDPMDRHMCHKCFWKKEAGFSSHLYVKNTSTMDDSRTIVPYDVL
ncbi:F-box family protein [Corchorus capsularis]|uniref:F-box family protein n=1 Tax=Corchorus capsularis TaxID=210143 RepID=A0A1R3JHE0_COCAP|nr:F-box family protein [Corchorus capsularis]